MGKERIHIIHIYPPDGHVVKMVAKNRLVTEKRSAKQNRVPMLRNGLRSLLRLFRRDAPKSQS